MTDPSRTMKFSSMALLSMAELGIAPTPENYLVWYRHHEGANAALSRLIRLLIDNKDGFSPERCAELHDRFFGGVDCVQIAEIGRQVLEVVSRIDEQLSRHDIDTRNYGEVLGATEADLGAMRHEQVPEPMTIAELREIMIELCGETQAMRERTCALQGQLERNSREIKDLRGDLENARRAAHTDPLTGIGNRKLYDEVIRREVGHALESGDPLSLLVLDIDHFKAFNDRHGHQIGDVVLRLVASRLTAAVKGRDTVARYGGEEFAIILPRTDADAATQLAQRLCADMANHRIRLRQRPDDLGQITLSVGVASYEPGESLGSFFDRADRALYRAKQEGRNRVVCQFPARRHEHMPV